MKLKLKNTRLLNCFFLSLATALISLVICLFQLKNTAQQEINSESERYQSYLVAERLRQSSDDLTSMSRLYVTTGEKKYRDYYNEVLAIRNGTAPLPVTYDEPYWDLVIANQLAQHYTPAKSLAEMMLEHHFTLKEFALLAEAENKSNLLAQIEIKAMNALEGKFDDGSGNYTVQGKPNQQLARQLLFGEDYLTAKANVMKPIRQFFEHVNLRTEKDNEALDDKMLHIIVIAISLAIISTVLMLFSGMPSAPSRRFTAWARFSDRLRLYSMVPRGSVWPMMLTGLPTFLMQSASESTTGVLAGDSSYWSLPK